AGRAVVVAALPALFFVTSCTVTEREVAQQGGRIDDLQVRLLRLERAVAEAGAAPAPSVPADPDFQRRVADLGQRLEEVGAEVRSLSGRVEAAERTPAAGAAAPRVDALESSVADLARRLEALERRAAAPPPAPVAAVPTPVPSSPTPGAPAPLSSQALYDKAYATYKEGRYEEARGLFRDYIAQHPDTPLTGNAYFWIGESHYDQGQYEQAILEYDKVVQRFPKGGKVAGALLKQAFAFDAIGDPVDARILLRKLLREHPNSEQAPIARRKLELLGE
ncbi:MAG: tol-pal system protein YbgF, partial [Thermodesulfobacteriota bacterium]